MQGLVLLKHSRCDSLVAQSDGAGSVIEAKTVPESAGSPADCRRWVLILSLQLRLDAVVQNVRAIDDVLV